MEKVNKQIAFLMCQNSSFYQHIVICRCFAIFAQATIVSSEKLIGRDTNVTNLEVSSGCNTVGTFERLSPLKVFSLSSLQLRVTLRSTVMSK
jgi:hypothetical protein